jgi:uncharacterized protein (DUF4415 family)
MAKKLSGLSLQEKLAKKSDKNISYGINTNKPKQEVKKIMRLSNNKIDYSDIPELDFDSLGKPVVGKFYRPLKKAVSIRLDSDLLDWFKSQPEKYQRLINKACRLYMHYIKTHGTQNT